MPCRMNALSHPQDNTRHKAQDTQHDTGYSLVFVSGQWKKRKKKKEKEKKKKKEKKKTHGR